jgi:hypothetical protein
MEVRLADGLLVDWTMKERNERRGKVVQNPNFN